MTPVSHGRRPTPKCYRKRRAFQGKSFKLKKVARLDSRSRCASGTSRAAAALRAAACAGRATPAPRNMVSLARRKKVAPLPPSGPSPRALRRRCRLLLPCAHRGAEDRRDRLAELVGACRAHGVDRYREVAGADEDQVDAVGRGDRLGIGEPFGGLDLDRDHDLRIGARPDIRGCGSRSRRPVQARRRARPAGG